MTKLTKARRKLLEEVAETGFATIYRSHARVVLALADLGLVTWRWNEYRIDFASVAITDKGRAALANGERDHA